MSSYFEKADSKKTRRRKQVMFCSLLVCCLAASLNAASFATQYWFKADSRWKVYPNITSGNVNFGLFAGTNTLSATNRVHNLYVVCENNKCMYSCGSTEEDRKEQIEMLFKGETQGLKDNCDDLTSASSPKESPVKMVGLAKSQDGGDNTKDVHLQGNLESNSVETFDGNHEPFDVTNGPNNNNTNPSDADGLHFMDYGLWVGTIACLSGALLMAVVGALFAIVNTATSPIEAITGVPGLYLWNGLAAVFDILTVILWAVQFHTNLSNNVLLYDASDGWSTKGLEVFGYSFWLVVGAIFVHVANIVIIAVGTHEKRDKTDFQKPETKGGIDNMLF